MARSHAIRSLVLIAIPCGIMMACGAAPPEPRAPGCPSDMARIDPPGKAAYCIDRYEATLVEIGSDGRIVDRWENLIDLQEVQQALQKLPPMH